MTIYARASSKLKIRPWISQNSKEYLFVLKRIIFLLIFILFLLFLKSEFNQIFCHRTFNRIFLNTFSWNSTWAYFLWFEYSLSIFLPKIFLIKVVPATAISYNRYITVSPHKMTNKCYYTSKKFIYLSV